MAASVKYFAQLSDGLQAVAAHAGRTFVEPSDVAVVFKRQRLSSKTKSLADLLHEQLPMECVDVLVPKARAVAK